MSENSKIQWTDNTGGPWMICDPVSPGCANCYAWELMENRLGGGENSVVRRAYKAAGFEDWKTRPVWGKTAPRVLTKGFWTQIIASDKAAAKRGERVKSFPSMIDWLDEMPAGIIDQDGKRLDPIAVLADFLDIVRRTPNTDHLLLTKRPENWSGLFLEAHRAMDGNASFERWAEAWFSCKPPANVWIGATVENQEYADKRIPELLKIPAVCRFISYEPALEAVRWPVSKFYRDEDLEPTGQFRTHEGRHQLQLKIRKGAKPAINWLIVGGESGAQARPFNVEWARSTVGQCRAAAVACFVKQLGARPTTLDGFGQSHYLVLRDKKGGDMAEWPEDLRVREFPVIKC